MGIVLGIVGASGTGKSSLIHALAEKYGANVLCSYTTRRPRPGEVDGQDYHFLSSVDEVDKIDWLELVKFSGNFYGTTRKMFADAFARPGVSMIAVNIDGARLLKKEFGDKVSLILLTMPEDVRRNLLERRDGVEAAAKRLATEDPPPKPSDADWDFVLPNNGHQWGEIQGIIEAAYFDA